MKRSLLWILASTVGVALSLLFVATLISAQGDVPVFKFNPEVSVVNFNVSASVPIEGKFNKWDATLTFTSRELSTGVLDIKIDAASVDTGSGMKDGKLKGKDFFDVKNNPYVTFHSSKIEQTGPNSFDVSGTLPSGEYLNPKS
jgi:polyisoprenoid-binding protein YceI